MKSRFCEVTGELRYDEDDPLENIFKEIGEQRGERLRTSLTNEEFMLCLELFVIPLVERSKWRPNYTIKTFSNIVSVSDEAFGILVMENNIDDWIAELTPTEEGKEKHKRGSLCKYTKSLTRNGRLNDGLLNNRGWNIEGRERYNDIFDVVKQQRTELDSMEKERYMLEEWKKRDGEIKSRRGRLTQEELNLKEREEAYMPRIEFYD